MAIVFVCKACEDRPCFYQCDKALSEARGVFDESRFKQPEHCPMGKNSQWEVATQEQNLQYSMIYALDEWLNSDGWDKCPEEIRELILSFGISTSQGVNISKAQKVFGVLEEYDNDGYLFFEDFKNDLNKFSRMEIVAGLLPEAIRIGVIWREKYLQEHGK